MERRKIIVTLIIEVNPERGFEEGLESLTKEVTKDIAFLRDNPKKVYLKSGMIHTNYHQGLSVNRTIHEVKV